MEKESEKAWVVDAGTGTKAKVRRHWSAEER